jgi:ubiquinone/menaquinone biosynthesis C-methylase UbiE
VESVRLHAPLPVAPGHRQKAWRSTRGGSIDGVDGAREPGDVTFAVAARSYDRYMGRYSTELAPRLVSFAGIAPGMRALDVGCGPGALTAALADRLGAESVAAADPSEPLLAACAERIPGIDARVAPAERLPWRDESFDAVASQLVLNFLRDADAGVREMRRVAQPDGLLASCTWDYAHGMQMLRAFWDAALELDPTAPDEGRVMRYCTERELADLWTRQGFVGVETTPLEIEVTYASFADYWEPFTLGAGPGGAYYVSLAPERREALREACHRRLGSPNGSLSLSARAFAVPGRRPA